MGLYSVWWAEDALLSGRDLRGSCSESPSESKLEPSDSAYLWRRTVSETRRMMHANSTTTFNRTVHEDAFKQALIADDAHNGDLEGRMT